MKELTQINTAQIKILYLTLKNKHVTKIQKSSGQNFLTEFLWVWTIETKTITNYK